MYVKGSGSFPFPSNGRILFVVHFFFATIGRLHNLKIGGRIIEFLLTPLFEGTKIKMKRFNSIVKMFLACAAVITIWQFSVIDSQKKFLINISHYDKVSSTGNNTVRSNDTSYPGKHKSNQDMTAETYKEDQIETETVTVTSSHDDENSTSVPPSPTTTLGAIKREEIMNVCGELCNINRTIHTPNPNFGYFGATTANIDCNSLFQSTILDEPGQFKSAPRMEDIPAEFIDDFRMNGRAELQDWWIQDIALGKAKVSTWSEDMIETWKAMALQNDFTKFGNYQLIDRSTLFGVLRDVSKVQNQSVLVIGSESPWIEALALAAGAANVTTLEYGEIHSFHPQVKTYTPDKFRQAFLDDKLGKFDAIISYSSLEHSGLGRYGDALNPFGDIMAVARAWCVTKPAGTMTLGLSSMGDKDLVYFNAGRIYGPNRWPYVTTNWARVNYTSRWTDEVVKRAPVLYPRLRGPVGHEIFWNQSSLVFRRTGPAGSEDELHNTSLLLL